MKIYKNPIEWNPEWGKKIIPVLGALLVLLVLWTLFNPSANALQATLEKSTLSLNENESTLLYVRVTNPSGNIQTNVLVSVQTPGSTQLGVYPAEQTIATLGPQETRTLEFLITPLDARSQPFLTGTYRIDVATVLNNQNYRTSVFLNVVK